MLIWNFFRAYIKQVTTKNGFLEVTPVLIVFYYLFSTSLIPINLYYRFFSTPFLEHYYFNNLTYLSPLLLLFLALRFRPNYFLLITSILFFLIFAFSTLFADEISLRSLIIAFYTVLPFMYCAFLTFSRLQIQSIAILSLTLLFLVCLQVYFYGLGFGSYISKYGDGSSIGELGVATRVLTTVGAATGTSVFIVLLSFVLLSLRQKIGKFEIAIFIIMTTSVFVTYSRGSLILILVYLLIRFNPFSDIRSFVKRFSNVLLIIFFLGVSLIGIFSFFPSVVDVWTDRFYYSMSKGELDSGRFLRVEHALTEFESSNYSGVGLGHYSPRKKIIPTTFTRLEFLGRSSPHNVYLLLLVEAGIVGLIAYLFFVLKILLSSRKKKVFLPIFIPIFLLGHNVEYVYIMYPYIWALALLVAIALSHKIRPRILN